MLEPALPENENTLVRDLPRAKKLRTLYSALLTEKVCKSVIDNLEYTFKYLRILYLSKSEKYLPEKGVEGLTCLRSLSINTCNHLLSLVRGMENMTALQVLRLQDCAELTLGDFNVSSLISLETLEIRNCLKLDLVKRRKTIREDVLKTSKSLQYLILGNKKKLNEEKQSEAEKPEEEIEEINLGGLRKLRFLVISGLPKLNNLPKWFQNASDSLHCLTIDDCKNFYDLPDWLGSFTSLHRIEIVNCPLLSNLPKGMQDLTALRTLRLCDCQMLTLGVVNLNFFISLELLEIRNCAKLDLVKRKKKQVIMPRLIMEDEETVKKIKHPHSPIKYQETVKKLKHPHSTIKYDNEEEEEEEEGEINEKGFGKLKTLIIDNLPKLRSLPKGLETAAGSLQLLSIANCQRFHKFPAWSKNFTSFQKLEIRNCPQLSYQGDGLSKFGIQQQLLPSRRPVCSLSWQKPRNPMPAHDHLIPPYPMPGHEGPGKITDKVWNKKKFHDEHLIPLPVDVWWKKHAKD
ncbi:hypothetical protein ACFE04_006533 [Oxalis oulophora]